METQISVPDQKSPFTTFEVKTKPKRLISGCSIESEESLFSLPDPDNDNSFCENGVTAAIGKQLKSQQQRHGLQGDTCSMGNFQKNEEDMVGTVEETKILNFENCGTPSRVRAENPEAKGFEITGEALSVDTKDQSKSGAVSKKRCSPRKKGKKKEKKHSQRQQSNCIALVRSKF